MLLPTPTAANAPDLVKKHPPLPRLLRQNHTADPIKIATDVSTITHKHTLDPISTPSLKRFKQTFTPDLVRYHRSPSGYVFFLSIRVDQALFFGVRLFRLSALTRRSRCGIARSCSRLASAAGPATRSSARSLPCLPCRRACRPRRKL